MTEYFGFSDIEDPNITELDLSGQPIISFEGISKLKNLKKLNVQNTLISSFKGAAYMSHLTEIDFRNTILCRYPFVREMCLFAFNLNLKKINGTNVSDEKNRCKNNIYKKNIEKLVRRGSFIILNPQGTFYESTNKCSYESSLRIENYNDNSVKPKVSTDEIVKNLYQSASELRKIRLENHNNQKCFRLQTAQKFNEDSIESLRNELNSLKPPIEYLRDQIRFEAQKKKDSLTISTLQSQLLDDQQKLQKTETSLRNANDSISRLQEELKKLYENKDQYLIDQVNTFCSKLNEIREENMNYNRLISENEILTSKLAKCKETVPNDRSLDFDLNKILEAAESLKNEKEQTDSKLSTLNSKIDAQTKEIEKLTAEEQAKIQAKIQIQKEIEQKMKEKINAQNDLSQTIIREREEMKKLAEEFQRKVQEIRESINEKNEPTIDDLTFIPHV